MTVREYLLAGCLHEKQVSAKSIPRSRSPEPEPGCGRGVFEGAQTCAEQGLNRDCTADLVTLNPKADEKSLCISSSFHRERPAFMTG